MAKFFTENSSLVSKTDDYNNGSHDNSVGVSTSECKGKGKTKDKTSKEVIIVNILLRYIQSIRLQPWNRYQDLQIMMIMFATVSHVKQKMRNYSYICLDITAKRLATLNNFLLYLCILKNTKSSVYYSFIGPPNSCA